MTPELTVMPQWEVYYAEDAQYDGYRAAGREQIGHASTYQQMRDRIAGSELREIDTAGHNICDGYAGRCVASIR
jgi:histidine ammonia-lyase